MNKQKRKLQHRAYELSKKENLTFKERNVLNIHLKKQKHEKHNL